MSAAAEALGKARRVVVKVGSALVAGKSGLNEGWLTGFVDDLSARRRAGVDIVVVSSGAIALGARRLDVKAPRRRLAHAQATAAVGQISLARAYEDRFAARGISAAQVLLTLDDLEDRRAYLNARETLSTLLDWGAVPVVNENDTTATEEIRFGDNDRLAARVAQMVGADLLVILSDVDGLYSADPGRDRGALWIGEVDRITPEIDAMASGPNDGAPGSGGMVTKLAAAKIATAAGVAMLIGRGDLAAPLEAIACGESRATLFRSATPIKSARKQWLAGRQEIEGRVGVDAGALAALRRGRSLLPAGIVQVDGDFDRGGVIEVVGPDGTVVGRGLAAYPAAEARDIIGVSSRDIAEKLGYARGAEMIHRDDLVLEGKDE